MRDKKIEGISDLRDESDRKGMRIVIEIKRGNSAEVILNNLYKHTQLQTSVGIIMLAVVDGQPRVLPLIQFFQHFLRHRVEVVERRTRFELAKAEARAHVLEGFRKALDNLEAVIEKIKAAATPADARAALMGEFALSEIQAKEILELRLQRLTGMEQKKIQDEFAQVRTNIAEFQAILADPERVMDVIREETRALKAPYADPRRTEIIGSAQILEVEDLITEEEMVVTISHAGYIKRAAINLYRTQRRGGKGKMGMSTREEDFVERMFVASTHDYLLIFTTAGKVYWKKVHELPLTGRTGRGKAMVNLLPLEPGEQIRAYLTVADFSPGRFVVMATANGILKKTELVAFSNPRAAGVRAINIDDGDRLVTVDLTEGDQEIFLATRNGLSSRFREREVRTIGRVGRGVIGIRLNPGDRVVGMEILSGDGVMLTLTENGFGKKTQIRDYRVGSRGNKGIFTIKTSQRNGGVVGIIQLGAEDEVMIITQRGKLIRLNLDKLRAIGRVTQGVKLIQLEPDERVVAIAKIEENEHDATDETPSGGDNPPAPERPLN
ncbi:MAG: DNA gyrase C-terminal beta-propeller domain-containing protein [bacterium]